MKLFTQTQYDQLIENGKDMGEYKDHHPVVRLYITGTACTWLLTELCPDEPDIAFGLCDLGMGFPEIGYVSIQEITDAQGPFQRLERDLYFNGEYPISVYAEAARDIGQITLDETVLKQAAYKL
ncbi:DUF2958 domain-containing protein [Mucilaginibacter psychrotolerans]|uniref:DUF2958 domain-containing protein n=1 Tax=Mucilaginibacter psychrotolerans TaxID=1524096 RepID=A0A4Y8SH21_9SPHI|nr:DUF2958 domain-containing protein [Mucilaginibacter psychrotolerans]TFF37935.1 DUF2958 domain-containing protein [Mucilaginibacter psychrotolerans]